MIATRCSNTTPVIPTTAVSVSAPIFWLISEVSTLETNTPDFRNLWRVHGQKRQTVSKEQHASEAPHRHVTRGRPACEIARVGKRGE